jgi:hypothetical protein
MKHEIEPVINQYFSCHQGLLATYAAYQKREYDMMFSESWGFNYQSGDHPFGSSLDPYYQNRREILLEKFHGIKVIDEKYTSKANLIDLLQSTLPQCPIILYCDVYNCPWNISYQRNHIDHYILAIGLSDNMEQIYILDPYSTKDENTVDIAHIAPDSGDISSFTTMQMNNLQAEDYFLEIKNSLNHINNIGFFQNIENFYSNYLTRFEEVMLSEYTDVYAIPLIINLRRIANQRYCYCMFLNKMISKKLLDPSISNMMEKIAEKYSLLRILLIKQVMKKRSNNECLDIISEIMSNEHDAYEKMKSYK